MAPEFAPVVVTLNSRVENGELTGVLEYVESEELPKKLRIRWSVEGQPDGYSAVGGGVAFVYHRDFRFQVIPGSEDARAITLGNDRYLWTEGLQFGVSELMFILILPKGYTLTDPSPLPVGTKIFEDRLALYWILRGNDQRTKVGWTIKGLQTGIKAELIRLNNEYLAGQPENLAMIEVEDTPIRQRRTVDIVRANVLARNKIFVSYSHKDGKLFEEFKTMLAPAIQSGLVDMWDDRKIVPGQKWKEEIEKALTSASVAVLLVSQNFLASHFIAEKELPPLLKAAREEGVSIFWICLSSCLFEQTEIATYQAAHDTSRPLDRLSKSQRQAVLSEICTKLIRTAQQAGPRVEPGSTEQFAGAHSKVPAPGPAESGVTVPDMYPPEAQKARAEATVPKATIDQTQIQGASQIPAYDVAPLAADEVRLRALIRQAERGSANAMEELGYAYDTGKGVPKDRGKAFHWHLRAAEAGNVTGMFNVANIYSIEESYKDEQKAFSWFRKAAEAGDRYGMMRLAHAYEHGLGIERDYGQAIVWYRKACEREVPGAEDGLERAILLEQESKKATGQP